MPTNALNNRYEIRAEEVVVRKVKYIVFADSPEQAVALALQGRVSTTYTNSEKVTERRI